MLSQSTKKLVQDYQAWHKSLQSKEGISTIHVDEVVLKVASFYEKIRGIIGWREEHLMKKTAIGRILKRRLLLKQEGKDIAEAFVLELIKGGYFPNDQIEEIKISRVEKTLNKYIYILDNSQEDSCDREKIRLYNWLLDIAACEIEEILSPPHKEKALIDCMTESMIERIKIKERKSVISIASITQEEKNRQIYIACQRALFKLDSLIINYHLLKKSYPRWANLAKEDLEKITENIYLIKKNIEKELNHFLKDKFYKICEKYDTPYLLIGDILEEHYQEIPEPERLEELIKNYYQKRMLALKKTLTKLSIYSTLSIFLINLVSFFVLEKQLASQSFTPLTIAFTILGPTVLMIFLAATIRPPSKSNLEIVLLETMKVFYQTDKKNTYEIKIPKKRGSLSKFIIVLLYLIGASIPLSIIIIVFNLASLSLISIIVNIIFLALVAFAGLAIKNKGEELTMEEKKSGLFDFIFDILFLPFVNFGYWMSNKWKKYNLIAIFINALIDLPFQIFIGFLEQWTHFLKEKKEEIH